MFIIYVYIFLLDCKEYRMFFKLIEYVKLVSIYLYMYLYLIMNCNFGGLIILVIILVVINFIVKLFEGYMYIDL